MHMHGDHGDSGVRKLQAEQHGVRKIITLYHVYGQGGLWGAPLMKGTKLNWCGRQVYRYGDGHLQAQLGQLSLMIFNNN